MQVQPYLFFDGSCEEALEFYKKAVGAEVTSLMRWNEAPEPQDASMVPPGSERKIMHASFRVGETEVLASDGHCQGKPNFQGFSLTIQVANEAEAKRLFAGLSEGGEVRLALTKTFFSPCFGMLGDKFGVGWMVWVA